MAKRVADPLDQLIVRTGLPARVCKPALAKAKGNIDRAIQVLRDQGKITEEDDEAAEEFMRGFGEAMQEMASLVGLTGKFEDAKVESALKQVALGAARLKKAQDEWEAKESELKGTRFRDPVLGLLRWDLGWTGKATDTGFGKRMELRVEADDGTEPTDAQREAYRHFIQIQKALRAKVEEANFRYYNKVRPRYFYEKGDRRMPTLTKSEALWRLLSHPSLYIPEQRRGQRHFCLNWASSWDVEHGHEVVIKNGKVQRVGIQGG